MLFEKRNKLPFLLILVVDASLSGSIIRLDGTMCGNDAHGNQLDLVSSIQEMFRQDSEGSLE